MSLVVVNKCKTKGISPCPIKKLWSFSTVTEILVIIPSQSKEHFGNIRQNQRLFQHLSLFPFQPFVFKLHWKKVKVHFCNYYTIQCLVLCPLTIIYLCTQISPSSLTLAYMFLTTWMLLKNFNPFFSFNPSFLSSSTSS